MSIKIIRYSDEWEGKWDRFVLNRSMNGTFLQTRNFLNYHPPGRFTDSSLIILKGSSIMAVIPACESIEDGNRCFFSHKGSTFGGIVIEPSNYKISTLEELFPFFESFLIREGFNSVFLKNTSDIFSKQSSELFDYYFYKNNYHLINEISFYVDCESMGENIADTWSYSRRRGYNYSLKHDFRFRKITDDEELFSFYHLLAVNLSRHHTQPVHTFDELLAFRDRRIPDNVEFYGVYYEKKLIAGAMLFLFGKDVLHTQYLAQDYEYSKLFPMNYLDYNLIKLAKENGFKRFSFGISTENRGKTLNVGLALFKEGFGTKYCNNRSYYKELRT